MRTSSLPLRTTLRSATVWCGIFAAGLVLTSCSQAPEDASSKASDGSTVTAESAGATAAPSSSQPSSQLPPRVPASAPNVPTLSVDIVAAHPFPGSPFVQGLEFEDDGSLLVGTGLYNQSQIYRLPRWTENPDHAEPEAIHNLAPELFGEGLTRHGDTVWQLTWREHRVIARDASTLVEKHSAHLQREGWGVCSFGDSLVLSDGTGTLSIRDPESFAETGQVPVTLGGRPTTWINELECVDGPAGREVWANVWQTNTIFRIDPVSGEVTGTVDASAVEKALPEEVRGQVDVLNGIAKIPGTDRYLVTGKKWPLAFEVRFSG